MLSEEENFLQQTVTSGELWTRKHPSSSVMNKLKTTIGSKTDVDSVWNFQGPIPEANQESGINVTSPIYCGILQRELKPTIYSKRTVKWHCIVARQDMLSHCSLHVRNTQKSGKSWYIHYTFQLYHHLVSTFLDSWRSFKRQIFLWSWHKHRSRVHQ